MLTSAPIIAPHDGEIATVDVNHDGRSEPGHDSCLEWHAQINGCNFSGIVGHAALQQAVVAAGGRIDEADFSTKLRDLPGMPGVTSLQLEESPQQFETMGVTRTLRVDDQGQLFMDYNA